jgi:hypothetical protein
VFLVLGLACFLDAVAAPSALARAGDAPDDGPGVHVYLGAPSVASAPCDARDRPAGTRVQLGMPSSGLRPGVRSISWLAEALVCSADDTCVTPGSGTVVLDAVTELGLRGRYTLDVAGGPISADFTAPWCDRPVTGPMVHPTALAGFDVSTHEGHLVALTGVLFLGDRPVLAESSHETSPPRPAGTVVPLDLSPTTQAALQEGAWVAIRGQVRGGALVVHEVAPSS